MKIQYYQVIYRQFAKVWTSVQLFKSEEEFRNSLTFKNDAVIIEMRPVIEIEE